MLRLYFVTRENYAKLFYLKGRRPVSLRNHRLLWTANFNCVESYSKRALMIHHRLNNFSNFTLIEAYPEQGFFVPSSAEENIKCFGSYHYSGNVKFIDSVTDDFFYRSTGEFHNDLQSKQSTSMYLEAIEANTSFIYLSYFDEPLFASKQEVTSETSISPGAGVLVVRGQIFANDNNNLIEANELNYIKPREYPYIINGNATVLLITT